MKKLVLVGLMLIVPLAQAEEWITEEVLKQLSEIRQELKVLQDEVRSLKEQVARKPTVRETPPAGPLDISDSPFIGDDNAKYAIVEFSDYQCPYCRRHYKQTLPAIEQKYISSGDVKYVMKQFPLGFHPKARQASIAALCIEQLKPGNYWKAHESIFSGETKLGDEGYQDLALSLGIKVDKFESCLQDSSIADRIDADLRQGEEIGVRGTPAFYIGRVVGGNVVDGQLISGARPFSSFSAALDELQK